MFIELEKKSVKIPFGETFLKLRYTNEAFLYIEKKGVSPFDTRVLYESAAAARVFITAGLQDCLEELNAENRTEEIVNALMADNKGDLIPFIQLAVLNALPLDNQSGEKGKKSDANGNAGTFMCLYCDIMHRTEEEFWKSTLREISERWERYAVLKGYKEAPLQVQRFDD